MRVLTRDEALVSLFQFLDYFCIESEVWIKAEQLLLNRMAKLPIEAMIPILEALSN